MFDFNSNRRCFESQYLINTVLPSIGRKWLSISSRFRAYSYANLVMEEKDKQSKERQDKIAKEYRSILSTTLGDKLLHGPLQKNIEALCIIPSSVRTQVWDKKLELRYFTYKPFEKYKEHEKVDSVLAELIKIDVHNLPSYLFFKDATEDARKHLIETLQKLFCSQTTLTYKPGMAYVGALIQSAYQHNFGPSHTAIKRFFIHFYHNDLVYQAEQNLLKHAFETMLNMLNPKLALLLHSNKTTVKMYQSWFNTYYTCFIDGTYGNLSYEFGLRVLDMVMIRGKKALLELGIAMCALHLSTECLEDEDSLSITARMARTPKSKLFEHLLFVEASKLQISDNDFYLILTRSRKKLTKDKRDLLVIREPGEESCCYFSQPYGISYTQVKK